MPGSRPLALWQLAVGYDEWAAVAGGSLTRQGCSELSTPTLCITAGVFAKSLGHK